MLRTKADAALHHGREYFGTYGDIKSVVVVHKSRCAFINYATRVSAELAAEQISQTGLKIKDHKLKVVWGRPRPQGPKSDKKSSAAGMFLTRYQEEKGKGKTDGFFLYAAPSGPLQPPPPPSMKPADKSAAYPSQDPTAQGATAK